MNFHQMHLHIPRTQIKSQDVTSCPFQPPRPPQGHHYADLWHTDQLCLLLHFVSLQSESRVSGFFCLPCLCTSCFIFFFCS